MGGQHHRVDLRITFTGEHPKKHELESLVDSLWSYEGTLTSHEDNVVELHLENASGEDVKGRIIGGFINPWLDSWKLPRDAVSVEFLHVEPR